MSKQITQETIDKIKEMQSNGISLSQISRELHLSLNTIKKYLNDKPTKALTVEVISPNDVQYIQPSPNMKVTLTLNIERLYFLEKYREKSGLKSVSDAVIKCIDDVINYWANLEPVNENQTPISNINKLFEYAVIMKLMRSL